MARRLLRSGAGRAALIAGTAAAVTRSTRRANHKANSSTDDVATSLKRLAELKASGALTDKEFKAAKAKLLF